MFRHAAVLLAVATFLAPAPAAQAQAAGTRIRVTTSSHERLTGRLVAQRADSLVLAADSGATIRTLAVFEVARIDTSRGMRKSTLRSGAIGFLAGVSAGALVGAATSTPPPCEGAFCFEGLEQVVGAMTGGLLGGVLGAGIGAYLGSREREGWSAVRRSAGISGVSIAPSGGSGVRVAASLRF